MYAIAELIQQELSKRNWRKSELVSAMGYKSISRGLKRLEYCLQQGDCTNRDFLSRLSRTLELSPERLKAIIAKTQKQCADEVQNRVVQEEAQKRARFQPYVYVRTSETRPPFTTAATTIGPRLKFLRLENIVLMLPRPLLLSRITEMVRTHYRDNIGKCLLFGEITGYALRISYDETVEFNVDGSLLRESSGWTEDEGHAMLIRGKHIIQDGLFGIAG